MMAMMKIKYVGTGDYDVEPGVTLNQEYWVLGLLGSAANNLRAVILDDNDLPKATVEDAIRNPLIWEIVSVDALGDNRLYP